MDNQVCIYLSARLALVICLFSFACSFASRTGLVDRAFDFFVLVFACIEIGFAIAVFTAVNDHNLNLEKSRRLTLGTSRVMVYMG